MIKRSTIYTGSMYAVAQSGSGVMRSVVDIPVRCRMGYSFLGKAGVGMFWSLIPMKNHYILIQLKGKALSLLRSQFAKKPKNPV